MKILAVEGKQVLVQFGAPGGEIWVEVSLLRDLIRQGGLKGKIKVGLTFPA